MFPITYKNVLQPDHLVTLYKGLDEHWSYTNVSANAEAGRFFTHRERNLPEFMDVGTRIKLKVLRDLKRPIKLCRIQVNGQSFGSGSAFHQDYLEPDTWTVILFTTPVWDSEWGAEFVCIDPETREYKYVPYIPNTATIIPSNWYHKGTSPQMKTPFLRTSLAFTYVAEESFDQMMANHPDLLCFR